MRGESPSLLQGGKGFLFDEPQPVVGQEDEGGPYVGGIVPAGKATRKFPRHPDGRKGKTKKRKGVGQLSSRGVQGEEERFRKKKGISFFQINFRKGSFRWPRG